MARQLSVDATPVGEGYILGLRESFATAETEGVKLDWCHTFGFGKTALSLQVDFPDGTQVSETVNLHQLMQAWALQIINEHTIQRLDAGDYYLCGASSDCPFFVDENPAWYEGSNYAKWIHLIRGDDTDNAEEDRLNHEPIPGDHHPLDWWKEHGPDRVKERFTS